MTGFPGPNACTVLVVKSVTPSDGSSIRNREEHGPVAEPRQLPDPAQAGLVINTIFIPSA
jgi:hypothetical protein